MNIKYLLIFTFLFFCANSFGQHLELMDDKGEAGVMVGYGSYNGDIAPDVQFIKMNYGAYYKKQLNEFVGIRLNYQSFSLNVNDNKSSNAYAIARGFYFQRNFHEVTVMSQLYFNRFISGRKHYRFSPYLGFGAGLLITGSVDNSSNGSSKNQYPVIPVNFGLKYSISSHINVFAEYKQSFTTSDYIDHLSDVQLYKNPNTKDLFQGSKSGKDNLLSAQIGISYNFRKVYGPDPVKQQKHKNTGTDMNDKGSKSSKLNIFKLFKRK
jgi:hypothetical protein